MTSNTTTVRIPAPNGGLDMSAPSDLNTENTAQELVNYLPDKPGLIRARGPVLMHENSPAAIANVPWGCMVHGDNVAVSSFLGTGLFPWKVPYVATGTPDIGTTECRVFNRETRAWTSVVLPNAFTSFGLRSARLGNVTFFNYYGSSDPNVVINGKNSSRSHLGYWDGSALAGGFGFYTDAIGAPQGSQDLITHKNRLFLAGGRDVAGGAAANAWELNTIFFSDPGGPFTLTPADWQDDVSGLSNKIVIGDNDNSDYLVGMAHERDNLIIFKRNSTYIMSGYSPSNFTVMALSHEIGCYDPHSIAEVDGGVVWISARGVEYFDGTSITTMSSPIEPVITELIGRHLSSSRSSVYGLGRCQALSGNWVYVTIGDVYLGNTPFLYSNADGVGTPNSFLFHVPTRTWTGCTLPIATSVGFPITGSEGLGVYLTTKSAAGEIWAIGNSAYTGANKVHAAELQTIPFPEKSIGITGGRARVSDTTITSAGAFNVTIPPYLKWRSKMVELSSPYGMSQVQKWGVTHNTRYNVGVPDGVPTANLYAFQNTFTPTSSTVTLTPHAFNAGSVYQSALWSQQHRDAHDDFHEAEAVSVKVEAVPLATSTTNWWQISKIHNAWVEYQPSRRRSTP